MADIFGEISGTMKKAIESIDKRQKVLVEEIKKDGTQLIDKAAETTENVIESIDSHIENLKGTTEDPDGSIVQLEKFLETLRSDIDNLTKIVDQRAKELQVAVKKNSEIILDDISDDLERIQGTVVEGLREARTETDDGKRNAIMDDLIGGINDFSAELGNRMEELKDSGEEISKKAVAETEKQMNQLSKVLSDLRDDFPIKMKVTGEEPKAPVKKAKKVAKPKK